MLIFREINEGTTKLSSILTKTDWNFDLIFNESSTTGTETEVDQYKADIPRELVWNFP